MDRPTYPELFLQVQDVLTGRRHAGDKHQRHHSYLKGTVYCEQGDSRFIMTLANGHGGAYLYFFCSGRQRGNGCRTTRHHLRPVAARKGTGGSGT